MQSSSTSPPPPETLRNQNNNRKIRHDRTLIRKRTAKYIWFRLGIAALYSPILTLAVDRVVLEYVVQEIDVCDFVAVLVISISLSIAAVPNDSVPFNIGVVPLNHTMPGLGRHSMERKVYASIVWTRDDRVLGSLHLASVRQVHRPGDY